MPTATAFRHQLQCYRLTTAEIVYHLPDHPALLQNYVWQELDLAPVFPALRQFLSFWEREIEGRLHSVRVGTAGVFTAAEWRRLGQGRNAAPH